MTMLGTLQIVEVRSVEIEVLANGARLRSLGDSIVASLGLAVLGEPQWHAFPPRDGSVGGHTGLWLLAESHLALHSFPELRALTIDLHTCRGGRPFPWIDVLPRALGPCTVHVRVVNRDEAP